MSFQVRDGQIKKYRRSGAMDPTVEVVVPAGEFLKPTGVVNEYGLIDETSCPVVFLNLTNSDRPDCVDGGLALIGGASYELATDHFDATATFLPEAAITVKGGSIAGTDNVSGVIAVASSGDYIHGWVKEAPAAANDNKLVVIMSATNDGEVV